MGKFFYPLSDLNDRYEFELDRARSKNNIAENSFAQGHETDSTIFFLVISHLFADDVTYTVLVLIKLKK